jgi:hypothetical protein
MVSCRFSLKPIHCFQQHSLEISEGNSFHPWACEPPRQLTSANQGSAFPEPPFRAWQISPPRFRLTTKNKYSYWYSDTHHFMNWVLSKTTLHPTRRITSPLHLPHFSLAHLHLSSAQVVLACSDQAPGVVVTESMQRLNHLMAGSELKSLGVLGDAWAMVFDSSHGAWWIMVMVELNVVVSWHLHLEILLVMRFSPVAKLHGPTRS